MAGRKRKPAEIRELEGNRGHRPIPDAPKAAPAFPDAPGHLDRYGRAEWRERGRVLYDLGVLTETDLTAFAAYCYAYAQWRQAEGKARLEWSREMRQYMSEFGLTPAARSRLAIDRSEQESAMDDLLSGPQGLVKAE